jgi:hypothetical protein
MTTVIGSLAGGMTFVAASRVDSKPYRGIATGCEALREQS